MAATYTLRSARFAGGATLIHGYKVFHLSEDSEISTTLHGLQLT